MTEFMITTRKAKGRFTSFTDFLEKIELVCCNKRTIESLIKAGGFDSLGHPRKGLLQVFEPIVDMTMARRRQEDQGVMSLFDDASSAGAAFDDRPAIPDVEFEKTEKLRFEKEMLGLYVSDHPIMGLEDALRRRTEVTLRELIEQAEAAESGEAVVEVPPPTRGKDGRERERVVNVGGVITSLQHKFTRNNDRMAVFVLEDLEASLEVTVFPRTFETIGHVLADDLVVTMKARLDTRDDEAFALVSDEARDACVEKREAEF